METVLVVGNFNALHPGHLRLLRFARSYGERLVVGVLSRAISGVDGLAGDEERAANVGELALVDDTVIVRTSVENLVSELRPDVVVKGSEHRGRDNPEEAVLRSYGGRLVFATADLSFEASPPLPAVRTGVVEAFDRILAPGGVGSRRRVSRERLMDIVQRVADLGFCVVGDLIVDEYVSCEAIGMSREDPTVVVAPLATERFLGGAGIIAGHVAGLGARCDLISAVGDDEAGSFARSKLDEFGVSGHLRSDGDQTAVKGRIRVQNKTILRINRSRREAPTTSQRAWILDRVSEVGSSRSGILLADFGLGVLAGSAGAEVASLARQVASFAAADSQTSSQVGDVTRFRGFDLLAPTEHEARLGLRDPDSGLVVLAEQLRSLTGARDVILTLGAEGVLIQSLDPNLGPVTDAVPALNAAPVDVAGAGDSLLAMASTALCSGATIWEASILGSLAAAIQISRVGNRPVTRTEMLSVLSR